MNVQQIKKILFSGIAIVIVSFVVAQTAEARCRSYCQAERSANNQWSGSGGFLDKGGLATTTPNGGYLSGAGAAAASAAAAGAASAASSATAGLPLGGTVTVTIPCTANASTAFIILPVGTASPGPYVISNSGISLKAFWAVMPGNWVLGTAYTTGVCSIYVGPYIFSFSAQQVSIMPGLGTSIGA